MMKDTSLPVPAFDFIQGDSPLLVSIPHSGLNVTPEVAAGLTTKASLLPDTDWYIPELYDCLEGLGVSHIKANYSRYVIDLNRPIDDKPLYTTKTTGLFPEILFDDSPVFEKDRAPAIEQRKTYKTHIWQAYHGKIKQELERIKDQFGYAILFDAHSIAAEVPMLFDGKLPDFNWGTNQGKSCHASLLDAVQKVVLPSYHQVANGRFKGGYITREFGQPNNNIHAIQLELSQATYLDGALASKQQYSLDKQKAPMIKLQLKNAIEATLTIRL